MAHRISVAAVRSVHLVHDSNFRSQRAVAKLGAREVAREEDCRDRGTNIRFELDRLSFFAGRG